MRVGLVIYGDLRTTSGGYLYDRELVSYLREQGDRVEVVSLPRRTYRGHLADNLSRSVYRRLRGQYDLLLQDELCHPSLVLPNRRLDRGYPVVPIVHSAKTAESRTSRWHRLYRTIERQYLATVDGVVANSRATAATIRRLVDVPVLVSPPGRGNRPCDVDPTEIAIRATERPLRIVFVGNLIPRKGAHTLVAALGRLPKESWRLTAVGSLDRDGQYVSRLRRSIRRSGLDDRVTLTGHLSDDHLEGTLRRQHLLAVPSTYEAFGIAYLEGMGYGLPALATTAGGAPEFVTDRENGFLVPPADPGAIASAVRTVLDDADRLREMSLAARETYDRHHTWAETGRRVREFGRGLIGDREAVR